ncbi:transcriptional adapter 1-like [Rhodnius prolixus]|uniref:Transcriptional adapter 1 n=1 Tax=Rhodnius prolixus TaxID=13249 RepID=R4G3H6_RHOPR
MGEFDSIIAIRQTLMESLGDRSEEYLQLMNRWFRMELTRHEFECEASKCLTGSQLHLHNQLILKVLKKCAHITASSNEPKPTWNRSSSHINHTFEPVDTIFYDVTERQEVDAELPPFISHDRLLPDTSTMMVRATFAAWEHGLEAASTEVADLLCLATHQFLRSIIVAVIRKRKGCCFMNNGFVHAVGKASLNPWLRSVAKNNNGEYHNLTLDANVKGFLAPSLRRSKEELYQKELFSIAASDAPSVPLAPITVSDILYTLKLHPSLVASYFTKTVNTERMYARFTYPCDD